MHDNDAAPISRELEIEMVPVGGDLVLVIRGEIDIMNVEQFARALLTACQRGTNLVVDLEHVPFMDVLALRELQRTRYALERHLRSLQVTHPSRSVRRLMVAMQLEDLLVA